MTHPFGDIIQFASRNRGEGVLIEPRFYYDRLDFTSTLVSEQALPYSQEVPQTDPDSYKNGEQFPVRLTHMIVAPALMQETSDNAVVFTRSSLAQKLMLRVERYGEYYMNETHIRASAWHNVACAPPANVGESLVSHTFFQPVVLSARDSLRVDIEAIYPAASQQMFIPPPGATQEVLLNSVPVDGLGATLGGEVYVALGGGGTRYGRPYVLSGGARPTTEGGLTFFSVDPSQLQNIGNEPIALTSISVNAAVKTIFDPNNQPTPGRIYDTRFFRVRIRQQGNGTQANWFRGPTFPQLIDRMPLSMLGTSINTAVVHRFPGDGIQLDPGEFVRVTGLNEKYGPFESTVTEPDVIPRIYDVAFAGYIMVT